MEKTKKHQIAIIIPLILLSVIILVSLVGNKQKTPEFCLTIEPSYLLLCNIGNETISAISSQENLGRALEQNCSIAGQHDTIDIIYCHQETNLTKFKISVKSFQK